MKCELCHAEYDLAKVTEACQARCAKWSSCGLTPCPTCFSETVLEPEWFQKVFSS